MFRFQSAPYQVSLNIIFCQKHLNFDTLFIDLLWIGMYISNDMHFINIVVDLKTLNDLFINFTNNPCTFYANHDLIKTTMSNKRYRTHYKI